MSGFYYVAFANYYLMHIRNSNSMDQPKLTDQQDANQWCEFLKGSSMAFEFLYDKYFPILFRYGMHFSKDRAQVKDCLQDLFINMYTHRASLKPAENVRNYLYSSFRRRMIRDNQQAKKMYDELPDHYDFVVVFSHEQELIASQLDELQVKKMLKAFAQLSKRQKEAVYLRFYENMTYEEIAAVMEFKEVKYARTLVYRAIAVLKEAVKNRDGSLTLYSLPSFYFVPFLYKLLFRF